MVRTPFYETPGVRGETCWSANTLWLNFTTPTLYPNMGDSKGQTRLSLHAAYPFNSWGIPIPEYIHTAYTPCLY